MLVLRASTEEEARDWANEISHWSQQCREDSGRSDVVVTDPGVIGVGGGSGGGSRSSPLRGRGMSGVAAGQKQLEKLSKGLLLYI